MSGLRRMAWVVALLFGPVACGGGAPAPSNLLGNPSPVPVTTTEPLATDAVNLKVYFRAGTGTGAYLVPVVRQVEIRDDLPRHALELLLSGPSDSDGRDVQAVLPSSTRVLSFAIEGDTAHIELSRHVLEDASTVSNSPEAELLALAALANTLTEFPAIDRIRLAIDGDPPDGEPDQAAREFWGGWGLPEILVRDESVVGLPREGEGMPELSRFSEEPQTLGDEAAGTVTVTSVRTRDRTTYLRLVVELADGEGSDAPPGAVPTATAFLDGDAIVLELDGVAVYDADVAPGQRMQFNDPSFDDVQIEPADLPGTVRLRITPSTPRQFWLHQLSSPTRVVLDVRK